MPMATKLLSVVGARPQFVKIAPLCRAIERHNAKSGRVAVDHVIVHTGQHYDVSMSDVFFRDLDIPTADLNLGVGSAGHGEQTAQMLSRLEEALLTLRPDMVVTYGDTNSTVAGALAAVKLHIPIAHVEAGLRSFNRRMPEEINRVIADHVCDLLLAPTPTAVANLEKEGRGERVQLTGDIMYDAVLAQRAHFEARAAVCGRLGLQRGAYGVVTVHRADNTDDAGRLRSLTRALNAVAALGLSLVFPLHPRTAARLSKTAGWVAHPGIRIVDPVGYLDMLWLVANAAVVLTDSGGLQKEAFFLGRPCVTLREETEWVETVQWGGNVLAGVEPDAIVTAVTDALARATSGPLDFSAAIRDAFGDGQAAERIITALLDFASRRKSGRHS
jgi:UDP-GlcNAc3NAcA epimerase